MNSFIILSKKLFFFCFLIFFCGFSKGNKLSEENLDLKSEISSESSTFSYETNQYNDESFFVSDFSQKMPKNTSNREKFEDEIGFSFNSIEKSIQKSDDENKNLTLSIKPLESKSLLFFGSYINTLINVPQISPQDLLKFKLFISNEQSYTNICIDKILHFIGFKSRVNDLKKMFHEKKILSIIYPAFNL